MPPRFIELSHAIEPGMQTYPGLPVPVQSLVMDHASSRATYQGAAEFLIASLHLCGNTGTYVDSPFHRYRDGADLAAVSLASLAQLRVRVFDAREHGRSIGPELFDGAAIAGAAVLIRTDHSQHFGTERYFERHPFLTAAAAERLRDARAAFVGIDSLNIDDTTDPVRPVHTLLLGANIPICEHMTNLAAVSGERGYLHAVPIAWRGGASFPVRAYVVTEG